MKEVRAPDLTERERVELIVKAFVFCKEELAEGDISDQFAREVKDGQRPDRKVVREVIEKWREK